VRISSAHRDSSVREKGMEAGRSVAQVYVPTLQERAHVALSGPFGLVLEVVNFALSMFIFFAYIAEVRVWAMMLHHLILADSKRVAQLYNKDIYYSDSRTVVEAIATSFFICDFGLHLFVAADPWKYFFSAHGMIDLVTIIPSLIVVGALWSSYQLLSINKYSHCLVVCRPKQSIQSDVCVSSAPHISHSAGTAAGSLYQIQKERLRVRGRSCRHPDAFLLRNGRRNPNLLGCAQLGVFILSAIAVILCAAGIYQALEADEYEDDEKLQFHDSLYFVLVTVSTIGKTAPSLLNARCLTRGLFRQHLQATAMSHLALQWVTCS
jgi:hypothetical protein